MTPPKGYKHTELGILPQDWEVVRLGEVCDVRDGTHESPKPKDEGKILITSKNLKNGRIDFSDSYCISLEDFESINKRSKVEKYDVLMSMIGTVGEVALIDCVPDFAIKNVALFKTNGDIKLSRYLFFFFQSPSGKKRISSFLSGSTQKYITLDFLRNLQIPLPPLAEQEKIAEILSTWDTQIQNYEFLIKEKQTLKKGLCQTLLTAKTRLKGFSEDWEVVRLGEVCKNFGGKSLEKEVVKDGKYRFISIGNYSVDGRYIDNGQRISLNQNTQEKLLKKGELVMVLNDKTSNGRIIGSTILIDKNDMYIYNQRSEKLVCSKQLDSLFAWFFLNSENTRRRIFKMSQGGTQIYINFSSIKNLQILLPPLAEQEKIAEILGEGDREITLLEQKLESLKSQKKGLMQNLLKGKVMVK